MTRTKAPELPVTERVRDKLIEPLVDTLLNEPLATSIEPIEHRHMSGWIPFTDGGWVGWITVDFYDPIGDAVPQIEPMRTADYDDAVRQFAEEHDVPADINHWGHPEWDDWIHGWEDGDLSVWFVKVRAVFYDTDNSRNDSGEPEWVFDLIVNDDVNYGRESVGAWAGDCGDHYITSTTATVAELEAEPDRLDQIRRDFESAWIALIRTPNRKKETA